jgi:general secretion pathway protein K
LLTFFAAAKKVSAAPHRGNANKPEAKQGKANTPRTTTKKKPAQQKKTENLTPD